MCLFLSLGLALTLFLTFTLLSLSLFLALILTHSLTHSLSFFLYSLLLSLTNCPLPSLLQAESPTSALPCRPLWEPSWGGKGFQSSQANWPTALLTVCRPQPSFLRTLFLCWILRPCLLLVGPGQKAEAGAESAETRLRFPRREWDMWKSAGFLSQKLQAALVAPRFLISGEPTIRHLGIEARTKPPRLGINLSEDFLW